MLLHEPVPASHHHTGHPPNPAPVVLTNCKSKVPSAILTTQAYVIYHMISIIYLVILPLALRSRTRHVRKKRNAQLASPPGTPALLPPSCSCTPARMWAL
jgi:hypothetical protein